MKGNTKTIIIFSPAFPADEQDNWLPWLQNTVQSINHNFPELKIIIFSFKYPGYTGLYKWKNNEVRCFGSKKRNKITTLLSWIKIFNAFKQIKKTSSVAGILSVWCGECAYVAKFCARSAGIKHYSWIVGQDARAGNKYVQKIKPGSEQLVAMSDFLQSEFYKNYTIQPAHIITTGINTALYKTEFCKKTIDILGVGSLCQLKQYDVFIDVVNEIKKTIPNIKSAICGDGEEKTDLQNKVVSLLMQQNILLQGEMQHTTIIEQMQQSKILLHPSLYEGFSNVCLEALYAGTHVISFTRAMNADIKNWHVVTTKEEMVDKAIALLTDNNTVYEKVLYHTFDDTAKKLVALFV
jgi:glycosyltransferase involved in cell wall biosynthesis